MTTTDINAVIERVRSKYEYVSYQVLITTDDRDALLAHIAALTAKRDAERTNLERVKTILTRKLEGAMWARDMERARVDVLTAERNEARAKVARLGWGSNWRSLP